MKKCILVIRVNYGSLGVMNPFLYVDTEIKCSDEVYFVQFTKRFFNWRQMLKMKISCIGNLRHL